MCAALKSQRFTLSLPECIWSVYTVVNQIQCMYGHVYTLQGGKTLHNDFFLKIEFDVWLLSSTIEVTRVQVLDRSLSLLWRYSALFAIPPLPKQLRNYGLRSCYACVAFPHTMREPEIN